MNLIELKTAKELTLDGVDVSLTTQDKTVRELLLIQNGKRFIVKVGAPYSDAIKIFRADEFTTEKKHVLEGDVLGIKVCEFFNDPYAAEKRKAEIEAETSKAKLSIAERDVTTKDDGKIVGGGADLIEVPF